MAWRGLDRMAYMIKKLADFFRFTNWDYHNKKLQPEIAVVFYLSVVQFLLLDFGLNLQ